VSPTLVSAGAGSGKTHWIIEHIVARVLKGTPIERIAAVTFTEAAAAELEARLRARLLRAGAREQAARLEAASVCTIHRFSLELLRRYPTAVGLAPDPLVLDERAMEHLRNAALDRAIERRDPRALDALLDGLGPAAGLIERGRDDGETPVGRLRAMIRAVLDKARSVAMDAARLRAEAEPAAERLAASLRAGAKGSASLDDALLAALREARSFVAARAEAPTQKDKPLFAIVAGVDDDTMAGIESTEEARRALAMSIASSSSIDASKQFAAGTALKKACDVFCLHHPSVHRLLANVASSVITLAADAADDYDDAKRRIGAVDFDDMQSLALSLLEGPRRYAPLVASTLDLIVVDEFQDSAPLQFRLFELLRREGVAVAYVGDLKQAIYGFRAADSALFGALLDRERARGDALDQTVRLTASRRSRRELVAFANDLFDALFAKTAVRFDALAADNAYTRGAIEKGSPCVEVLRHASVERGPIIGAKARALAGRLSSLVETESVLDRETGRVRPARWSDITILARTHAGLARWARDLRAYGIPAALEHGPWFDTVEAQLALAWLRMVASPRDSAASASVLASELYGLSQRSIAALHARGLGGTPRFALEVHRADPTQLSLDDAERTVLARCAQELSAAREAFRTLALGEAVERTLGSVELAMRMSLRCDEAGAAQVSANVRAFAEVAHELASHDERAMGVRDAHGSTLEALIVELEALRDGGASQPRAELGRDAVSLVTLHASKGLEFAIVVLDALGATVEPRLPRVELRRPPVDEWVTDGALGAMAIDVVPSTGAAGLWDQLASLGDAATQLRDEQLRLLYVAVTRAREHLVLLWPEEPKTPSQTRYVRDLVTDCVSRPPSAAGRAGWVLRAGGASHEVLVVHAGTEARDEAPVLEDGSSDEHREGIERYRAVIEAARLQDDAARAAPRASREADTEAGAVRAVALSPTELVHLDDCPEVSRLAMLYPNEHRIARDRSIEIDVRPIRSARAERLALAEVDSALLGAWMHDALAAALDRGEVDEAALERWIARSDPAIDGDALRAFARSALSSMREALEALGVTEVLAQERAFVVQAGGTIVRGAIDLLVRTAAGLRVVDLKTQPIDATALERNAAYYQRQLDAYAFAVESLLGERIVGRDLVFVSAGALVSLRAPFDRSSFESDVRRLGVLAATEARGPGAGASCDVCPWAPLCRSGDGRERREG